MIVREARAILDLHTSLRRVAASKAPSADWARKRLTALEAGVDLTQADAEAIAAAELETFPVNRIGHDDRDPEFANRLAKRAIPIGELLELEPPEPNRPPAVRRRLPIP